MSDDVLTEMTNLAEQVDALESQNQALQEENGRLAWLQGENALLQERAEKAVQAARATGMKLGEATAFARSLESQNQALQERIEEVAGYAVQLRPLSHEQALILPKLLLQLLSPTQETYPG